MPRDLFGDWENFFSTSALISSVNPVANLTEPLGSQYLVCFLHQQWRINHSASFCFPGFVDVAPLQGTNLFWIREGDESHDLSRHFLPFLSPFLFYKVRCFEGSDSWMRLNRDWDNTYFLGIKSPIQSNLTVTNWKATTKINPQINQQAIPLV